MSNPSKTDVVIEAFLNEQAKKISGTHVSTDGHTLYSYTMPIARHAPDKTMLIVRYANAPSSTTRQHVRAVEAATRNTRQDLFISYVEDIDNDRRELFPNIGPGARARTRAARSQGPTMRLTSKSKGRSKLVFPEHGGVLVDEDTKVVKTIKAKATDGTYTIKIVRYHPDMNAMYVNAGRAFGYHYLTPQGGVVGSNSGNSASVAECLDKAIASIEDTISSERRTKRETRKSPERKAQDRLKEHAKFFFKHAGYSCGSGQTPRQGRMEGAMKLAQAEHEAEERGWTVEWNYDNEPYDMDDAETEMPSEVLVAILKDASGNVIGSLSGIGDPDNNYRRVVEAELALEALAR
jgi:hypothetical protein